MFENPTELNTLQYLLVFICAVLYLIQQIVILFNFAVHELLYSEPNIENSIMAFIKIVDQALSHEVRKNAYVLEYACTYINYTQCG